MAYGLKASSCDPLTCSITIQLWYIIKLKLGFYVWEETKNIFSQNISILWMGQNKRSKTKQWDKTMAKPISMVKNQKKTIIWSKKVCKTWKESNWHKKRFILNGLQSYKIQITSNIYPTQFYSHFQQNHNLRVICPKSDFKFKWKYLSNKGEWTRQL